MKLFPQDTVREAVLNAIAHRSMIVQNDVVIKLSPNELTITNVEKSGQGVDKMFTNCIMEAKPLPDYSATDNFQVSLTLRTEIRNGAFMVYSRQEQNRRPEHHKLNVFQLLAMYSVCMGNAIPDVAAAAVDGLVDEGLLVRSKTGKLSMGKEYKKIAKEMSETKNGELNGEINGGINGQIRDQLEGQLNENQRKTLGYIRQHDENNTNQISAGLGVPFDTIDKHIRVLLKLGLIEHLGSKRTGGYHAL